MSARADRRRFAILGVLHEHGSLYASDIAQLVHHRVDADLAALQTLGKVVTEWNQAPEGQRRPVWRIATPAERNRPGPGPRPRRVVVIDTRTPRMHPAPRTAATGA